jgi:hypothetical protein
VRSQNGEGGAKAGIRLGGLKHRPAHFGFDLSVDDLPDGQAVPHQERFDIVGVRDAAHAGA